jgi:hypothetical protein
MMLVSSAAAVLFEDAPAQAAGHAETEQQEKQSRFQPMHVFRPPNIARLCY